MTAKMVITGKIDTNSIDDPGKGKSIAANETKISNWVIASQVFLTIGIVSLLIAATGLSGVLFHFTHATLEILLGAGAISTLFGMIFMNNSNEKKIYDPKDYGLAGIKNTNNNCWLNSMMQILLNSQDLKEKLKKLNPCFATFMTSYQNHIEKENQDSPNSQPIREFLSTKCQDIRIEGEFQDLHEPLNIILDCIRPQKNTLFTTNHFVGSDRAHTTSCTKESNNGIINLPIAVGSNYTVQNLLNGYFNSEQDNEIPVYEEGLRPVEEKYCFGLLSRTKMVTQRFLKGTKTLVLEERRLAFAPKNLFLNIQRYLINPQVSVDFEINIDKEHFEDKKDGKYTLDSFAVHTGFHYISYVLRNGVWFCCDDNWVETVSEDQAKKAARKAYILHYKKI
ncbi:MAG: ubiquitin carboxyl-terminal hydrolase family protein [Parachlamydiales bacterium]|jgi:hypothetical protein